jgi:hypothetical protein
LRFIPEGGGSSLPICAKRGNNEKGFRVVSSVIFNESGI